jgi:acyl-CoA thioesterase FadM
MKTVEEHVNDAPETPFHRLLDEFIQCLPTNFIARYEKLVGRTAQQVRAEAETKAAAVEPPTKAVVEQPPAAAEAVEPPAA